jgi:hypothetical protein
MMQMTEKQMAVAVVAAAKEMEMAELGALSRQLAAFAHNAEEVAAIMKQRQEIINKYRLEEAKGEATLTKLQMDNWKSLAKSIEGNMSSAFMSLLDRTTTMGQKMRNMFSDIGKSIAKMLSDLAAQQIMDYAKAQSASHTTAATQVADNAAVAGTAAAGSAAQDGPYGWAAAIPIGLGVAAAALAMFSAESGFDVPSGMNPVTQLHQNEMVLPAEHADTIRNLKDGAGSQTHIHIHAMDAKSFKQALMGNQGGLLDVLHTAIRNGRK